MLSSHVSRCKQKQNGGIFCTSSDISQAVKSSGISQQHRKVGTTCSRVQSCIAFTNEAELASIGLKVYGPGKNIYYWFQNPMFPSPPTLPPHFDSQERNIERNTKLPSTCRYVIPRSPSPKIDDRFWLWPGLNITRNSVGVKLPPLSWFQQVVCVCVRRTQLI